MIDGTTLALIRAMAGSGGGGVTEEQVRQIVQTALSSYSTTAEMNTAIATAIAEIVDGDNLAYGGGA